MQTKSKKTYKSAGYGEPVFVTDDLGTWTLKHHVFHAPTGFAWGYGGSGPAELARCILWDYLGHEPSAAQYHQFKWDLIASRDGDSPFELTSTEINTWFSNNEVLSAW